MQDEDTTHNDETVDISKSLNSIEKHLKGIHFWVVVIAITCIIAMITLFEINGW